MIESKRRLRKHIDTYFSRKKHRCHYLKWVLVDSDWSIRYFWVFDSRPGFQRKWVLKSHSTKEYIILSQSEALDYIGVLHNGQYHKQEV